MIPGRLCERRSAFYDIPSSRQSLGRSGPILMASQYYKAAVSLDAWPLPLPVADWQTIFALRDEDSHRQETEMRR
jgi:hypothetical protein